eukprot:comp21319_c0_seq1/m.29189 comp21319_c0_seq1/g.29189  ORF comp21319_c0_seq1/g.29189 comp21319_c0_seq1/m.29189 type:complete len:296 (-) comp21319_c0_seq1:494-1381(-)
MAHYAGASNVAYGTPGWTPQQPQPAQAFRAPTTTGGSAGGPVQNVFMAGQWKLPISVAELEAMDLRMLYDVATTLREEHATVLKDEDYATQKLNELEEKYRLQPHADTGAQIVALRQGNMAKLTAKRKMIEDTYAVIERIHKRKKEEHGQRPSTPQDPSSPTSQAQQAATPVPTGYGRGAMKPNEPEGENPVLFKRKLNDLMAQIDSRQKLDEDVEDLLQEYCEHLVEDAVRHSCLLAHHRGSSSLEPEDITLHIRQKWQVPAEGGQGGPVRPRLRRNRPRPFQEVQHAGPGVRR